MGEWKTVTLDDVTTILGDGLHGTPVYDDQGEYYFINGNNLINGRIHLKPETRRVAVDEYKKHKKQLNERTILVSINGTLGNIALYNGEPCVLGKSACYFNVDEAVDRLYVKYVLMDKTFQSYICEYATGTTIKNMSLKAMREFAFELPDEDEQHAIASVLSSLDAKIDLLHRQNKTLEAMAETLFRQWFVEEAEEGWEEMRLDQFSTVGIGRTPPRKEQHWFSTDSADMKWISIKDMAAEGPFIFSTAEFLTEEAVERFRVPVIPKDTVVLSFKMTLGRLKITTEAMLSNEAISHFRINPDSHVTKEFLYLGLKTYQYETLGSTSTIVDSINSGMIREMVLQIPPEPLMDRFMEQSGPWFGKIKSNQVQIQTLTALRDTLLPKLMSGEVRVEEIIAA